jgi:hypothetical protein
VTFRRLMRGVVTSPFDLVLGYDPSAEISRLETCHTAPFLAAGRQYDSRPSKRFTCLSMGRDV